jgi:two-component system LytT family sensor kinase
MTSMQLPRPGQIARAYLVSLAFWFCLTLLMGFQNQPLNQQHLLASVAALMVEVVLRTLALAFWSPPIFYLVGNYLSASTHRLRYALLWVFGALLFILLNTSILWLFAPPYDAALQRFGPRTFQEWLEMIRNGFADQIFIYVAVVVAAHAYFYLKRLQREERERYEYQQALAATELQVLKMQLHPHFLFNTLHGIATLVDSDAKSAKTMIIKLSNLLRKALDRGSSDLIPLEEELKFLREYLDLEKMRLGSRLRIDWQIAPEASRLLVPQMILQPLAENAIRHGIASAREGGWLEISASLTQASLIIKLRNSIGPRGASNGSGVGLRNAEARLKYLYSGDASLRFEVSADRTATVIVSVPALNSRQATTDARPPQAASERENPSCEFSSSTTNP